MVSVKRGVEPIGRKVRSTRLWMYRLIAPTLLLDLMFTYANSEVEQTLPDVFEARIVKEILA